MESLLFQQVLLCFYCLHMPVQQKSDYTFEIEYFFINLFNCSKQVGQLIDFNLIKQTVLFSAKLEKNNSLLKTSVT